MTFIDEVKNVKVEWKKISEFVDTFTSNQIIEIGYF